MIQVVCGQLLVHWIEAALDRGVERDLWNLGFRNTITQLQAQAKDKQQVWHQYFYMKILSVTTHNNLPDI